MWTPGFLASVAAVCAYELRGKRWLSLLVWTLAYAALGLGVLCVDAAQYSSMRYEPRHLQEFQTAAFLPMVALNVVSLLAGRWRGKVGRPAGAVR